MTDVSHRKRSADRCPGMVAVEQRKRGAVNKVATTLAVLLAGLAWTACGSGEAPQSKVIHLAAGFEPQALPAGPWRSAAEGGPKLELRPEKNGGVWISARLPKSAFRGTPFPGVIRVRYPLPPVGAPKSGDSRSRLTTAGGTVWNPVPVARGVEHAAPGSYVLARRNLYAVVDPDSPPSAEDWRFDVFVDRGREVDGRWRLTMPRYSGDGLPVWPGESQSVECEIPANSSLRFATTAFNSNEDADNPIGRARFKVLLDGELLFEHEQVIRDQPQAIAHVLNLPPEARKRARFTFEVEGPACISAVLAPNVAPTKWERDGRPDIVLFLADTFRADNLRVYGGQGLTPNLDQLASESLVFERAWSPSPWTLPSQSSMLSGLYPHQHGVTQPVHSLGEEVQTLAERMRSAGYRTGAVTGGGYISPSFGLDQGFEWFDQSWTRWDVEVTAQGVQDFLAGEDGRPTFLFIQTYRAHGPYLEQAGAEGQLELDQAWLDVDARYQAASEGWLDGEPMSEELREVVGDMRVMYGSAVRALDRGFGVLRAQLEASGHWDGSWLLFTSDHGEAFGEHQNYGHGKGVWEELTRIPLMLRGPGLSPGSIAHSASLVDLPSTIAGIGGVSPAPRWGGQSLLELDGDRPAYFFDCSLGGREFTAGAVEGAFKLQLDDKPDAIEAARLRSAHNLELDPLERNNIGPELNAEQVEDLCLRLLALRTELYAAANPLLAEDTHAAMDALGYTGEEPSDL